MVDFIGKMVGGLFVAFIVTIIGLIVAALIWAAIAVVVGVLAVGLVVTAAATVLIIFMLPIAGFVFPFKGNTIIAKVRK